MMGSPAGLEAMREESLRSASAIDRATGKVKKYLVWLVIFLTIHGTAGFAMFNAEEAMQATTFAEFAY